MPGTAGGGLPDAEQIITADASGYLAALDKVIQKNQDWITKTREMQAEADRWQRTLDQFARNMPQIGVKVDTDQGFEQRVREMQAITDRLAETALKANEKMAQAWETHAESMREVAVSYDRIRAGAAEMASDTTNAGRQVASSFEDAGDAVGEFRQHVTGGGSEVRRLSQDMAELGRNAERAAASIDKVKSSGWTPAALAAAAAANAARSGEAALPPVRYYAGPSGPSGDDTGGLLGRILAGMASLTGGRAPRAAGPDPAGETQRALEEIRNSQESLVRQQRDRQDFVRQQEGLLNQSIAQILQDQADPARRTALREAAEAARVIEDSTSFTGGPGTRYRDAQGRFISVPAAAAGPAFIPFGAGPSVIEPRTRIGGTGAEPWAADWPGAGPPPPGGTGGLWPAFPGGDGGGGGGGGFFGSALGGAFGRGPTAAATSRVFTDFVRRWYGRAHWALMLTNEMLATVGPALAAGGMGALTGVQGFEELIPRGKAVFNTSEALGDSLGMTTGKAWGLKTSYLQNAQDIANGMATQLAGAAVNIIGSPGTGGAFAQLGLNTDAMFSRFAATLTQHFQKGGLGGKLGGLVTGGTGYLQQFGDVLANLGNTFMNLAPNLPGVGGDLLGLLSGGTGALAHLTGWLGGAAGPLLAGEAGLRWGPAIVGTAGRGLGRLGGIRGLGFLGDAGAVLGGLSAPEIAAAAAGTFLLSKGYTYQDPMQQRVAGMQTLLGQQGILPGLSMGVSQMQALARVKATDNTPTSFLSNIGQGLSGIYGGVNAWSPGQAWRGATQAVHGGWQLIKSIMSGGQDNTLTPGNYEVAQTAINNTAKAMVNALGSGQQIQSLWKSLSGTTIDMGKAFDVATMAQLQLGASFEKNGKLTDQAKTMIGNLYAGYAPMNMNSGQFGASVAAQTAAAGLQHTQIQAVNSAFDQMSQLITGGAATSAGLFGLLGGTPTSVKRGAIKMQASPAFSKMAGALAAGFTSPASAGAWNVLTNQQSGILPALEAQMNWLREAQTMGALDPGQTAGMGAFEIAQVLPLVAKSPAGLAMLSSYAQQFGMPGFKPGMSAKAMRTAMSRWLGGHAVDAKGYNRLMTLGTEGMSNLSADAQQFIQQIGSGVTSGLAGGVQNYGADMQAAFMKSYHGGPHPGYDLQALERYGTFMARAGVPKQGAVDMARYAMQVAGGGPGMQSMVARQLSGLYAKLQVQADTSQARAAINNLTHITSKPKVTVQAEVAAAQAAINAIKGKNIPVSVRAQGIAAVQNAIAAIHGKTVTVTINTVNRLITQVIGMGTPAGGVAPATFAGSGAPNMRLRAGAQTGMKVPGYGGGDIFPAMLEPGELVVPKHQVAGGLVDHLRGTIPGFAGGGFVGQAAYGPGAYWGMGSKMATWNPALYAQLMAAMNATQPHLPPYISGPVHANAVHADAIHAAIASGAASGGSSSSGKGVGPTLAQLNAEIRKAWQTLDKLYAEKDKGGLSGAALANLNAQIKNFWKTVLDPLYAQKDALTGGRHGSSPVSSQAANLAKIAKEFTVHLSGNIAKEVKNSTAARNIATALISKLTQEVQYAKSVQASMKAGLNLGGMDVTPGTGQGTVFEQMQSYSKSLSSFSKDLSKLGKGHLNKDLMKQIVAAGPVQGDALAQSILNDYGGIGAVNKQYAQIVKQANKLGIKASELQYGGHLSDNLRSGTVSSHGISINVNLNKGAGGTLDLTPEQVAAIVAKVQAALLKQAKKNKQTGVKAHGKSA